MSGTDSLTDLLLLCRWPQTILPNVLLRQGYMQPATRTGYSLGVASASGTGASAAPSSSTTSCYVSVLVCACRHVDAAKAVCLQPAGHTGRHTRSHCLHKLERTCTGQASGRALHPQAPAPAASHRQQRHRRQHRQQQRIGGSSSSSGSQHRRSLLAAAELLPTIGVRQLIPCSATGAVLRCAVLCCFAGMLHCDTFTEPWHSSCWVRAGCCLKGFSVGLTGP